MIIELVHKRRKKMPKQLLSLLALEMLKLVKKEAPNIFYKAGPSCIKGTCQEGKMSCKKAVEMKKLFENL